MRVETKRGCGSEIGAGTSGDGARRKHAAQHNQQQRHDRAAIAGRLDRLLVMLDGREARPALARQLCI